MSKEGFQGISSEHLARPIGIKMMNTLGSEWWKWGGLWGALYLEIQSISLGSNSLGNGKANVLSRESFGIYYWVLISRLAFPLRNKRKRFLRPDNSFNRSICWTSIRQSIWRPNSCSISRDLQNFWVRKMESSFDNYWRKLLTSVSYCVLCLKAVVWPCEKSCTSLTFNIIG